MAEAHRAEATRTEPGRSRVALVLAGGAARGAYEVGVVLHILTEVAKDLGRDVPIDILSGTSVGAINACVLAAHADEPKGRGERLAKHWVDLRVEHVVRPSKSQMLGMIGSVFRRRGSAPLPGATRTGGLLDSSGLEELVAQATPFTRIREMLRKGHLSALTVSTTHVASGHTVIFVERAEPGLPVWSRDPTLTVRRREIAAEHALASAAVPLLFPAVRIEGEFYCDGGLRQNVPLSPARRLGADGLIVVNPRYIAAGPGEARTDVAREAATEYPGPLFLLGKAMNALLLDRIDNDIDRLRRINAILDAGERRFGPTFVDAVNEELGANAPSRGIRPLRIVHIRASEDIGRLASDYVASPTFAARAPGWIGRLLRRLGEREGAGEADFLSYLLFDGEFSARLIDLGRRDARARHVELCAFFAAALAAQ